MDKMACDNDMPCSRWAAQGPKSALTGRVHKTAVKNRTNDFYAGRCLSGFARWAIRFSVWLRARRAMHLQRKVLQKTATCHRRAERDIRTMSAAELSEYGRSPGGQIPGFDDVLSGPLLAWPKPKDGKKID